MLANTHHLRKWIFTNDELLMHPHVFFGSTDQTWSDIPERTNDPKVLSHTGKLLILADTFPLMKVLLTLVRKVCPSSGANWKRVTILANGSEVSGS